MNCTLGNLKVKSEYLILKTLYTVWTNVPGHLYISPIGAAQPSQHGFHAVKLPVHSLHADVNTIGVLKLCRLLSQQNVGDFNTLCASTLGAL